MAGEIRRLLKVEEPAEQPLGIRRLGTTPRKHYSVEKVEFLSEPGIYIPAWIFVPERRSSARAILYASEAGKEQDGMEFGTVERLAQQGRLVISIDVRGVGETAPPHCQDLTGSRFEHLFSVETAAAYMAWHMDRCLFGMRVQDVLRGVEYALSREDLGAGGVDAVGRGSGALWILFAAALDDRIRSIVAEGGLLSYASLTRVDRYLHSAGVFARDILTSFDLPQVAAAISDRRLALVGPVDSMKKAVETGAAEREYGFTRQAYARAGVPGSFVIQQQDSDLPEQLLRLLG
jgi:cephalosporin-C deacetylase-like acetyl esterase